MRLKVLAIVVLLVVAGGAIFVSIGGLTPAAATNTTLLTTPASIADVTDDIAATGSVAATTTDTLTFGSIAGTKVTWSVTKVNVAVGATVKKGDVLATASTADVDSQINDATRAEKSAQLQYDQAIDDHNAATTTQTKRQTLEALYNAQSSLVKAQTTLADLKSLKATGATITAPENGTVTAVTITAGTDAPATADITMISSALEVSTSVVESDITSIKIGQQASVTISALNATLNGTVASISPVGTSSGSNGVVNFAVMVSLDAPPAGLRPGMTADITITAASATGVLSIPSRALSGSAGNYTVRVVAADGSVSTVPVQVGLVTATLAEIKSGLQAGDRVVTGTSTAQNSTTGTGGGGFGGLGGGTVIRGGGGFGR